MYRAIILSIVLAVFSFGCCWNAGNGELNICAEIDAATNDAGACTFTPTHPPLNLDGGFQE